MGVSNIFWSKTKRFRIRNLWVPDPEPCFLRWILEGFGSRTLPFEVGSEGFRIRNPPEPTSKGKVPDPEPSRTHLQKARFRIRNLALLKFGSERFRNPKVPDPEPFGFPESPLYCFPKVNIRPRSTRCRGVVLPESVSLSKKDWTSLWNTRIVFVLLNNIRFSKMISEIPHSLPIYSTQSFWNVL